MSLGNLIEIGLIAAGVPESFHSDVITKIMEAIDDEIMGQLREKEGVELPYDNDIIMAIDLKIT